MERLLDSSRPVPRSNWFWWGVGLFLLIVLGSALAERGAENAEARQMIGVVSAGATLGLMAGLSAVAISGVRRLRMQQLHVEQIGEQIQLKQFDRAAIGLDQYLSRPSRTPPLRVQALVYLAALLQRMERFEDAVRVQDTLLDEELLDQGTASALRLGRAMSLLREDHLVDADRAISELRRGPAGATAALALVELYRDVKTGHPAEALELFERRLADLRDQLGVRVSDAYALAARAYDLLGRKSEAQAAFGKATLLSPIGELFRRYPEVQKLAGQYRPTPTPGESA